MEKQVAYYELDLGLNHVSRRWSVAVHRSACTLAAVPGGSDGPGGVLVAGEDWIEYVHEGMEDLEDPGNAIIVPLPRRKLHADHKGVLITAIAVHRQKKGKFFAVCQTELGDAYKVSLDLQKGEGTYTVSGMTVSLLDTLPVANALNITKLGLLFVAAEFSNHTLYQFERIDLADVAPTMKSSQVREEIDALVSSSSSVELTRAQFFTTQRAASIACKFTPTMLQSLRQVDSILSLAPATGVLVGELAGGEVSPQVCLIMYSYMHVFVLSKKRTVSVHISRNIHTYVLLICYRYVADIHFVWPRA